MLLETAIVQPGFVVDVVSPYDARRLALRVDMDPPTAAAFSIERLDRLEPYELAELAPSYAKCRGILLRVRNTSSAPLVFRAQVTLGPDPGPVNRSLAEVLERWKREQYAAGRRGLS
jgi:hypothetical protein